MEELHRAERLQPSLLDRLTDLDPGRTRETLDQQTLTMAQLRRAVLRDLGWLLNATNLSAAMDLDGLPLVEASTLNFGIPGLAGMASERVRGMELEAAIAAAIRAFEPRIRAASLRVTARSGGETEGLPSLLFTITGELWAQPVPQQLFLETSIEIETRLAVVTDQKGRG